MLKYNEKLSELFNTFEQSVTSSCGCGLTARDIAIAKTAISLAMNNEALITDAIITAKQQQLTNDDIGQLAALVLERQSKGFQSLIAPLDSESCCAPTQNDGCCS
ncbi:hypothetical protein [Pseudoalteromonas luteoviolacea]|uniref:Uncharacterized protein n=1 Tax=Pseudoalteromonas luteoviolacea S4054 TaxID=1129367 RepID=A0A0F6ABU5_9GAMM|nr:hypothetical protein [Pseudoalteromonas luteoviolacea]AOT10597.1 hypothetical protein S4054249_22300 [Pseudoalteromonas luteoviolacea]AOT15335.1 hypothetical protein S40542_21295 [Pseudoalteromonas luteoviolacea]AOT20416.1 hypothetical protein S4054_22215 [Pseudoalteromonas luteoviolacea]KKE83692.1 hypothetical protein N479_12765 [Pseudoalteromonas luteoviolacea S4054]KZN71895.1 hypothetical protein N481_17125 [Pseudoalteromonas luteoviolacea S4047-1]